MGKNKKRKNIISPGSANSSLSTQSSLQHQQPARQSLPGPSGLQTHLSQVAHPGLIPGSFVGDFGQVSGQKRKHTANSSLSSSDDETSLSLTSSFQDFIKSGSSDPKLGISSSSQKVRSEQNLRTIVIDGSNVAMEHGKGSVFSTKGLELVINFFKLKGHKVLAFLPSYRSKTITPKNKPITHNFSLLQELYEENFIVYTPTRVYKNKTIIPYDDIFLLRYAARTDAVVVSNDNYRDLEDFQDLQEVIGKRILMFCFVGDIFMPTEDPLGINGPKLEQFLFISDEELGELRRNEEQYEKLSKDARVRAEEPQHQAPTFVTNMSNLEIDEGEAIQLSAEIAGHPTPSIEWSVKRSLASDEKITLSFDGRKASCIIEQASKRDEGIYKLKILNPLGEISSKINVSVIKRE